MSKADFPHWRYIAFRLTGDRPVSRRAMQNALTGRGRKEGISDDDLPRLTRYAWPHGIVRVHHHQLDAARQWLPRITWAVQDNVKVALRLKTVSASGTIKTLTDRVGFLEERGRPKDARGRSRDAGRPPRGQEKRPKGPADQPPAAKGATNRPPAAKGPTKGSRAAKGRVEDATKRTKARPPR